MLGRQNKQIIAELKRLGLEISLATLKRRLRTWKLSRQEVIDRSQIKELIEHKMEGVNADAGVRRMKQSLLTQHQMFVKEETVTQLMKEIDPDGMICRQKRVLKL